MLSDDALEFLLSIRGGMLCTRDANNRPAAQSCFLAEITPGYLVGLVPAHFTRTLTEHVANNGQAALVCSRIPGDHRSIQIKGRITALEQPEARQEQFLPTLEPLLPLFSQTHPVEMARAALDKLSSLPAYRLRFEVSEVFDQTPGPKAGRRIAGGES